MRQEIDERIYNPQFKKPNHKIVLPSSAFGLLREELVRNIGIQRLKGFLMRFGWEMGVADGRKALEANLPLKTLCIQGPIFHTTNGHIRGAEYTGYIELDKENRVLTLYGEGVWLDSFEAMEHLNRLGLSDTPVCYTLTGYASGYTSTVSKQEVLVKEVECIAKGDKACRWILKSLRNWGKEGDEEWQYYHQKPIVKELEDTYEQLLEKSNFILKLSTLQRKLTEEISKECSLQTIADLVFRETGIPILIEDTDKQLLAVSGVSPQEISKRHKRLRKPIILQNQVCGYCSFIYEPGWAHDKENDATLLDRITNAASLLFLNEKIRTESVMRIQGHFLDQLLNGHYKSGQEIIQRGKYVGLNLRLPFQLAILQSKTPVTLTMEDQFQLNEQIFEFVHQYFLKTKKRVLTGQWAGHIILLLTKEKDGERIEDFLRDFYKEIAAKFPRCRFKIGLSTEGEDIENLRAHYEEALVAVRMFSSQNIVSFQSLGIVGALINSSNVGTIKRMAEQELGDLIVAEDQKKRELVKTLYFYLRNGGNLRETMEDLAISMSGLKYRLQKLEEILGKDLRKPSDTYQLFLIIESLLAIGELEF